MPAKRQVLVKQKKQRVQVATKPRPPPTRLGGALRTLGGLGGRLLGGFAGQGDIGSQVGTNLGASISKWLGSGDYAVASNSLVRESASGYIPMMHKDAQTITVRHREFLTEVTGKIAFTVLRTFPINPGLALTFPWLAAIASQFSEYTVKGMVYHYVPTSGNAVSTTNAALGSVMLQTSYRATEAVPVSKVELLNEYWANESKPSDTFCHPIECDPKENPFNVQYVRTGDLATTENQLMYDLGSTRLAVSGQQADDIVLGDLWVTYEIELRKPKMTALTGEAEYSYGVNCSGSITNILPFGTTQTEVVDSLAGGATISGTAVTLAPGNVGTYLITLNATGATAFTNSGTTVTGSGSAKIQERSSTVTTGVNIIAIVTTFKVTNPNTTTVITPVFTTLTGCTGMVVQLTKINPSLAF